MRGHGTHVVDGRLIATLCGVGGHKVGEGCPPASPASYLACYRRRAPVQRAWMRIYTCNVEAYSSTSPPDLAVCQTYIAAIQHQCHMLDPGCR